MIIMCVCVYICVITKPKPNTKSFAQYQVEAPKWAASANSQEAVDQGQLAATTLKCTTFKRTKRVRNSSFQVQVGVLSQGLGLGPPRNGHHPRLFDPLPKKQICKQKANKSQPIQPQGWASSKAFAQRFLPWKWIVP